MPRDSLCVTFLLLKDAARLFTTTPPWQCHGRGRGDQCCMIMCGIHLISPISQLMIWETQGIHIPEWLPAVTSSCLPTSHCRLTLQAPSVSEHDWPKSWHCVTCHAAVHCVMFYWCNTVRVFLLYACNFGQYLALNGHLFVSLYY